jgi:endonuclease/exonuclease/phosphatase family metal-dependent hydrolase
VTVEGLQVLLVTTHLHNAPFVLPDFEQRIDALANDGTLTAKQQDEILGKLERSRARKISEISTLLTTAKEVRIRHGFKYVVLGGDFNSIPGSPVIRRIEEAGYRSATSEADPDDILTFDPIGNAENIAIGSKSKPPLPTYDIPEVEELLEPRRRITRQIDHLFGWGGLAGRDGARAMDEEWDGLIGSDHYGVVAVLVPAGGP